MGLFRKLREAVSPINRMTPAQIVRSMPSVWVRVPVCICAGYYGDKATEGETVDHTAMMRAMAGTDVQVYGRDPTTVCDGNPVRLALSLYSQMKEGSEREKLEDATMALLMGEMVEGGTSISVKLAAKSAELGFAHISKPVIGKLLAEGYPPSEDTLSEIIDEAFAKAMSVTD